MQLGYNTLMQTYKQILSTLVLLLLLPGISLGEYALNYKIEGLKDPALENAAKLLDNEKKAALKKSTQVALQRFFANGPKLIEKRYNLMAILTPLLKAI